MKWDQVYMDGEIMTHEARLGFDHPATIWVPGCLSTINLHKQWTEFAHNSVATVGGGVPGVGPIWCSRAIGFRSCPGNPIIKQEETRGNYSYNRSQTIGEVSLVCLISYGYINVGKYGFTQFQRQPY